MAKSKSIKKKTTQTKRSPKTSSVSSKPKRASNPRSTTKNASTTSNRPTPKRAPKKSNFKVSPVQKKRKKRKIPWKAILVLVAFVGLGSLGYYRSLSHQKLLQPGIDYLTAQENIDFTQITTKVDERNRQDAMNRISDVTDTTSMWSLFKNTVLLGDSRVYGFMSYGFLPENQVLAAAGYTINNIPEFEETIAAQQPSVLYFSYGVNDMGLNIGGNEGENGYQKIYEENIKSLLEKSPNSKVLVNSIIDPTPAAIAKNPNWNKVEDFNRQIKEMCERNNWTYVDNSPLSDGGNAPIYAGDGIHFLSTFYEEWAKNMLMAQYQKV